MNEPISSPVIPARQTPVYIVHSENDDLVLTPPMREAYDILCEQGFELQYLECANAGHSEGAIWSLPEQYQWLLDRLNGEPLDTNEICVRHEPQCCSASPEDVCTP